MKCLLLFQPQWIPFNPHMAGPAINIIKNHGHDVRLHDLNASFYNNILTPNFLFNAVKAAFDDFEKNAHHVFKRCPEESRLNHLPQAFPIGMQVWGKARIGNEPDYLVINTLAFRAHVHVG